MDGSEHEEEEHEEEETQATGSQDKPSSKEFHRFWKAVPFAPASVQKAMATVKTMSLRAGKQQKLAEMAKAHAAKQWDHKLFKSLESLEQDQGAQQRGQGIAQGDHAGQVRR